MKIPPRFRGRTAQIEEPIEHAGMWVYELSMWDLSGETQIGNPWLFGPFATEDIAKVEGKQIVKKVCQEVEQEMTGEKSNRYLDFKNGGVMRPWEEH